MLAHVMTTCEVGLPLQTSPVDALLVARPGKLALRPHLAIVSPAEVSLLHTHGVIKVKGGYPQQWVLSTLTGEAVEESINSRVNGCTQRIFEVIFNLLPCKAKITLK